MGWIILFALTAIAFGALWRFGGLPRSGLELLGAALCLGLAGYAWQGRPALIGTPVASRAETGNVDPALVAARRSMSGQFGSDAQWLDLADTLNRHGQSQTAVVAMRSGIRDNRNSPDLWVGLGNALVVHGDGLMSPAAVFAFQRAAKLSPEHPGPPFFYGLALAQQGKSEEAGNVWRGLLARTPENAPWRSDLEMRLASIGQTPAQP